MTGFEPATSSSRRTIWSPGLGARSAGCVQECPGLTRLARTDRYSVGYSVCPRSDRAAQASGWRHGTPSAIVATLYVVADWASYYGGVAAFSGTVFALTLAARTIRQSEEANESHEANRLRLWDSISVTFELAAAALFAVLVTIRGTLPATVLTILILAEGYFAYARYFIAFGRALSTGAKKGRYAWLMLFGRFCHLPHMA